MKVNQLRFGSVLSYLQMAVNFIIGMVYTPVMLRLLGQSEYGLYNTVASTISMLSVLKLGFNSSYIRYFSKYKVKNDEESISRLNGLFISIFTIIGVIALVCGLFLSFNLELVFDEGLTIAEYRTARILMLLLTFNLAVSFPTSVFTNIISAHEKFVYLKLLGILRTIGGPLVTLPLLIAGYKSVAMVVATLAVSIIVDICYFIFIKYYLKQRFVFRKVEEGIFKDIFIFTFFIALEIIVSQVNGNVGKVFLGRFSGTDAVAVYSVGYVFFNYFYQFALSISTVFTPRIHSIVNTTEFDLTQQRLQLTELFTKVGRIQFLFLSLIASGMVFFGKPFIRMWAGNGYDEAYIVAVILLLSVMVDLIQTVGVEILRAENKHKFRSIVNLIMAVFNIIVTIICCQKFGIVGATIGTAGSLLLSNGLIVNIYYHKQCNIDIVSFWKSIVRLSLGLIIPVAFGIVLNSIININGLLSLIVAIVLYTGVYCVSMWFFRMKQYEKNLVCKPLKKIFHNK